ncbi:AAA domain-containing protein [Nocardia sp. CDC153]|uniref:bifunctional RecB family nuclease/DEAD/DEAH box helicase n=1 Tax=Nocardia sp. CDC153 TaxID=3112167 RepID=UPI002DB94025|nr:AAA domain-containing protein [Nocardia sp. CDC153]MEC3952216.1 AAA domain-containing protein [Nocardia sp. CDC153]
MLFGDRVVCSTGDLVTAARCEFALLRALDAELGLVTPLDAPSPGALTRTPDPAVEHRLADLRDRHGSAVTRIHLPPPAHLALGLAAPTPRPHDLAARPQDHAPQPSGVTPRDDAAALSGGSGESGSNASAAARQVADRRGPTPVLAEDLRAEALAGLRAAHEETLAALRSDAEAVAGAVAFDGDFVARCDFLVRDHSPETHDYVVTGVAGRRDRIATLLGLAAMAEALRRNGFRAAPHARIWEDGVAVGHPLADMAVVYQARRARLNLIVDTKLGELLPVQWGDRRFLACGHCPTCTAELEARRDLLLVAGMRPATRAHLRDAGITTLDRLAVADTVVTGIPTATLTTLRLQAEVQILRERTDRPVHGLIDPAALAALPAPTRGDLFVSVTPACAPESGFLRSPSGIACATGDLVVTIRSATHPVGPTTARALELSDTRAEDLVGTRPTAAAEAAAHPGAISESASAAVEQRAQDAAHAAVTTVDPGPVPGVSTVALGFVAEPAAPKVERVFVIRVDERDGVGRAARRRDDAEELLGFLQERQRECNDLRIHHYRGDLRGLLHAIGERDSEGEDVVAELLPALVDLYPIVRAALVVGERSYDLHQLPPNQEECENGAEAVLRLRDWLLELADEHRVAPARRWSYDYAETGPDDIEAALREFAESDGIERGEAQEAAGLTAAALGYHRRERRPLRWAHDDRLDHPVAEWADTAGVLVADSGSVDTDWHSTGQRPMRRYLTLTGRLGTGNAPPPGTQVLTLYDRPAPGMAVTPGLRATACATVLGCALDTNFEDVVRVVEELPEGCEPYGELPTAIAPCPPGHDVHLSEALEDTAHQLLVTLPQVPETAVFDILCRRPPRLRTGDALPEVFGDHAAAVTAAVLDLDNSYAAVQGPPGTGKTDTTARAVERLVTRYRWRVGVVARSHQVVEHVLDAVVQVGVLPELVAKADTRSVAPEWLPIEASRYPRFLDNAVNGCVVGGLSSDFTDPERIARDSLDLLVIVDAGKFPLAEAIAVAVSARNLLLVGDPAPPSGRGAHPEPIAQSVLGRLLGPHRTLPAAYGYFLDRTWRMHPRMCGPVSRLRYDNRLRSNETVTLARELDGIPPGVRTVPVEHHGNSTESAEEAREIVRQVRTLLGLPWHTGALTRRLHPHDILVVAPYHAQVARIRTLLSRARIEDVLVGTPDHFQGREAAVVLVSMTTSAPEDAPHGIGALLSRHWLTSAISRAMWSAIIVRSPLLTEYLPATTAELSDLAAVLQLDRV